MVVLTPDLKESAKEEFLATWVELMRVPGVAVVAGYSLLSILLSRWWTLPMPVHPLST